MGYHIVLENSLGEEWDGRFAANEDEIEGAILALVKAQGYSIAAGDVIRVIETSPPRR